MKTLLAITAIALVGLALPQTAEAAHPTSSLTYVSGHSSCGCPIYTQRIFIGYDSCNRPVYRYVSVPVRHRCSHSSLSLGGGFLHLGGSHHSSSHRTSIHWGGLHLGGSYHGTPHHGSHHGSSHGGHHCSHLGGH